ncbi:MAG: hypothetical protein GY906_22015, partial [bacterium]|nr:hypothetical protein [bacterium]
AAVEDSVQPEVAPESEDVFAAEAVSESSHEPTEDFEVRAEPQPEEPETQAEQPPVNDVPAEPEATSAPPGGLPFPTVTLAQLAFEQGDHALAEKTLLEVLQRDPESAQARDLLTEVARAVSGEVHQAPAESGQDLVSRKIDRLHSWLGGIRLAAEQRVL